MKRGRTTVEELLAEGGLCSQYLKRFDLYDLDYPHPRTAYRKPKQKQRRYEHGPVVVRDRSQLRNAGRPGLHSIPGSTRRFYVASPLQPPNADDATHVEDGSEDKYGGEHPDIMPRSGSRFPQGLRGSNRTGPARMR